MTHGIVTIVTFVLAATLSFTLSTEPVQYLRTHDRAPDNHVSPKMVEFQDMRRFSRSQNGVREKDFFPLPKPVAKSEDKVSVYHAVYHNKREREMWRARDMFPLLSTLPGSGGQEKVPKDVESKIDRTVVEPPPPLLLQLIVPARRDLPPMTGIEGTSEFREELLVTASHTRRDQPDPRPSGVTLSNTLDHAPLSTPLHISPDTPLHTLPDHTPLHTPSDHTPLHTPPDHTPLHTPSDHTPLHTPPETHHSSSTGLHSQWEAVDTTSGAAIAEAVVPRERDLTSVSYSPDTLQDANPSCPTDKVSDLEFFWSWESILLVSLPAAWLATVAVLCFLTRSALGNKVLGRLCPPPAPEEPEQGHGIGFIDGSPGMRRRLTQCGEIMTVVSGIEAHSAEGETEGMEEGKEQTTERGVGEGMEECMGEDIGDLEAEENAEEGATTSDIWYFEKPPQPLPETDYGQGSLEEEQRVLRKLSLIQEEMFP